MGVLHGLTVSKTRVTRNCLQEPQEPDKTEFEEKDAQFDVHMQPQGRGPGRLNGFDLFRCVG